MLTEKDYCDKDLSATLIEVGFRGFGHFYYEKDSSKLKATHQLLTVRTSKELGHTLAISLYEAQKWLREENEIQIEIPTSFMDNGMWKFSFRLQTREFYDRAIGEWDYYEEALSEGIKEAIKILKEKEK